MKLALIGYGKMGKAVERLAREQNHQIVCRMDVQENPLTGGFSGEWVEQTDAIIDFSTAAAVPGNIQKAVDAGVPIVEGTTGWMAGLDDIRRTVEEGGGACLYSSNFSIGVQMLFYLARQAGKLVSRFSDYQPYVLEAHHVQKLDAPSGTALSLEKILAESYPQGVPVSSVRAGFFPGTHLIGFDSPVDTLTLEHTARSRDGFAQGALFAAHWIHNRKGFYSLEEVMFGDANG
jgi:4-hydroxy-tetrahydrodipicolinate reductase